MPDKVRNHLAGGGWAMGRLTAAKKTELREKPAEYYGLCMTCTHSQSCGFNRDVSQIVLGCDEFGIMTGSEAAISGDQGTGIELSSTEKFKGLCINCDIRLDCRLPKPEEGVWHCEDYI
jgi:hypothetical protein